MNEINDLGPKKGETAEQMRERVVEAQRDFDRQKAAHKAELMAEPAKTPEPIPAPVPVAQVNAPAPQAVIPTPAATPVVTGNSDVDTWLAKKGFKSHEDVALSLRELERELHRRAQEQRRQDPPPNAPQAPQVPMYPPGYAPVPPQVPPYGYAPANQPWMTQVPPPPPPPPISSDDLAQSYGFAPDDFKRVAAVASDMANATVRDQLSRALSPLAQQVNKVNSEVSRNREMMELMSEPTWKHPQVQFEMHRVLEEDPAIFQRQALPYRYAHDAALMRIAKSNLGGSPAAATPPTPTPASPAPGAARPPTTAGGNGNGSGAPNGSEPPANIEQFALREYPKLSLAEKREFLKTQGAFPKS